MKTIIGCSPITNKIFAGKILKNGLWGQNKQDVTDTAPLAVAQHLLQVNQSITFKYKGEGYQLTVTRL